MRPIMSNEFDNEATLKSDQGERDSLRRLANLLDSSIRLPGGFRIGLDGLIGLIPGIGDLLGTLISSYIVAAAARRGTSYTTIATMVYNIAVETIIGAIPIVGDIFDFAWKANEKNIALLEAYESDPQRSNRKNRVKLIVPIAVLLLVIAVAILISITLVKLVIGLF